MNCGTVSVISHSGGFRAWGDVYIEAVENFTITSDQNGIRCGPDNDMDKTTSADGNLDIINCGKVNITDTAKNAVAVYGDMIAKNVTSLNMIGEVKGLKTWGSASFIDCGTVKAIGRVEYDGFSDYEANEGFGIMSGEGVLIKNTTLEAYGAQYGIMTGYHCDEEEVPTGGDIVINKSNVKASCAEYGFAAIYAGDDSVIHSSILLTDAAIISPENGYIVNVDIDYTCQTVTGLPNLSLVENWGQAAKSVTFGALFQVQYDANGGTGTLIDDSGSYLPTSNVNVLANSFTRAGFEFTGWNTRADGSGTTYLAGDTFAIASDMTLYAIYKELPPPTTTTTEATTTTTEPTTTTEVTTTEVIHISTTASHDHLPATGENNLSQIVAGIALLLAGAGVSMLLVWNKVKERQ